MSQPGATLQVFSSKMPGEPIGTVALCTRDHLNAATATCLWTADFSFLKSGQSVQRFVVQGSILTLQRNECLQRMEGDWILFIDDDMVWQPGDIGRLVESWTEVSAGMDGPVIMGGLCHRRATPYDPTLYMRESPTSGGYRFLETWVHDIIEVDATGMAFVLIPVTALEAIMGIPWPSMAQREGLRPPPFFRWDGLLGEDIQFCQDAKAKGVRIFVDTRIQIGHIAEISVGQRNFLMEIALRSPEDEARVRESNDSVDLPTLSASEAKRRLGWA